MYIKKALIVAILITFVMAQTNDTVLSSDNQVSSSPVTSDNDFEDLNIVSLYENTTLEFSNSPYVQIFLESYEDQKFSAYLYQNQTLVQTLFENQQSFRSSIKNLNTDEYIIQLVNNNNDMQHIIYSFANETENMYYPFVLNNTDNLSIDIPVNTEFININVKSLNNVTFSVTLIQGSNSTDLLDGKCFNVTICQYPSFAIDSHFSHTLIIQDQYNSKQNYIEYDVQYDENSNSSTPASTIILAVILSLVLFGVFVIICVVLVLVIRKKRRNMVTVL